MNCQRTVIFVEGEKTEPKILKNIFDQLNISCEYDTNTNVESVTTKQRNFFESNITNKIFIRRAKAYQVHMLINKNEDFRKCIDLYALHDIHDALVIILMDVDNVPLEDIEYTTEHYNNDNNGIIILNSPMIESLVDLNATYSGVSSKYKQYMNTHHANRMTKINRLTLSEILNIHEESSRTVTSTSSLVSEMKVSDNFNDSSRCFYTTYSGILELLSVILITDTHEVKEILKASNIEI